MKKIAVVTDSDASLPMAVAASYEIRQVPIAIHFDTETFLSGVDLDDRGLFERVERSKKLPSTSAPSPNSFLTAFESAFANGADEVICLCVSSKVSATYQSALNAAEMLPGRSIRVIDTLNLSMAQGFMANKAVEGARAGPSVDEITAQVLDTGRRTQVYAVLATLKYLALSGRVGKLVAGMADTLNIKPILSVKDGKLDLLERVRTRKKAVDRLIELTGQYLAGKGIERAAIIHAAAPEAAADLQAQLCRTLPCPDPIITAEFGAGLSVHTGAGVVGLVVVAAP